MSGTFTNPVNAVMDVAEQIAATKLALDRIGERRRCPRIPLPVSATLRTLAGAEITGRQVDNISEGGFRLTVPVGFGVAVGQRYEVLLCRDDHDGEANDCIGEGHYATAVRTEIMLADDGNKDRVGVALRFDTPVVL